MILEEGCGLEVHSQLLLNEEGCIRATIELESYA